MSAMLAPYIDTSEPDANEFHRLRVGISRAIETGLTEEQLSEIRAWRGTKGRRTLCRLEDLEMILDRSKETLSSYEAGSRPIPGPVMRLMRALHRLVVNDPEPACRVIRDYSMRYHSERE